MFHGAGERLRRTPAYMRCARRDLPTLVTHSGPASVVLMAIPSVNQWD
jgi:hypothetical protein